MDQPRETEPQACSDRARRQLPGDDSLGGLAHLYAMRGEVDYARTLLGRQRTIIEDLGQRFVGAAFAWTAGAVEMLAGDPAAAERELLPAYETLQRMGAKAHVSVWAGAIAEAVYDQGLYEEAEQWAQISEEAAAGDASASEVGGWRGVRAKGLARQGEFDRAERLAREEAALLENTDDINSYAEALTDLAEVLRLAGRSEDESTRVLDLAVGLYERKGNLLSASETRDQLASYSG